MDQFYSIRLETERDWEDFKRRTIHLNKTITQEQRIQQFRVEAKKAWNNSNVEIETVEEIKNEEGKVITKKPSLIKAVAAYLKQYIYSKYYVDLIEYITGGEGIYPKKWDSNADAIKDKLLEAREFQEEDVQKWARNHHYDDSFLEEMKKLTI